MFAAFLQGHQSIISSMRCSFHCKSTYLYILYQYTMNKVATLSIVLFVCCCLSVSKANHNTITYYDPHSEQVYYNDPNITAYAARFDLMPCTIEKLTIRLSGGIAAQAATLHLYGHEGGGTTPQFRQELMTPLAIEKNEVGLQAITVVLPRPIRCDNNQVFVVIENLAENVKLVSDSKVKEASCFSVNNEPVMVQFLRGKDEQWRYGLFAFGIDLEVIPHADSSAPRNLANVTVPAGINDSLRFRSIAWDDINRDGWQDVLVGGRLYTNIQGIFKDESEVHQLSHLSDFSLFVDIDKDAYADIVVLQPRTDSIQQNSVVLYHNHAGKFSAPQFLPVYVSAPICFAVADINRDSYPDIFIGQGEDSAGVLQPDLFLINNTQGGYILHPMSYQDKYSSTTGAMWGDFNHDNLPDLYLVKHNGQYDELWQNNGDGTFTNTIDNSYTKYNTDRFGYKTGCDQADYDNDGDIDILQPQQINPSIYNQYKQSGSAILRNTGAPDYRFSTLDGITSGIEPEETHTGGSFGDINNDGLVDILLTTSCRCRYADMYIQNAEHQFSLESFQYGLHTVTAGIDATWVDFNNDGKLDIATGVDGMFTLFANVGAYNNNFVQIELDDIHTTTQAIGSTVTVYSQNNRYSKTVVSGRGYAMQSSPRLHFGIEKNTMVDSVVVQWPDGHIETFTDIPINTNTILHGKTNGTAGESLAGLTMRGYPNRFSVEAVFEYDLAQGVNVKLEIFSLLGEVVQILVDEHQRAGNYKIKWSGDNRYQAPQPNGTYLYKLTVDGQQSSGHITIQK